MITENDIKKKNVKITGNQSMVYCFSILIMIAWECISQESLDQGFWVGAIFDMEFDKLAKLFGSIVIIRTEN